MIALSDVTSGENLADVLVLFVSLEGIEANALHICIKVRIFFM